MEVVEIDPNDLVPNEFNPRVLTNAKRDQIRRSLIKFGFKEPIVVNQHPDRMNVIVGGNQRRELAIELGYPTVPVVHVHLTVDQEKELLIRLNDGADWDYGKMAEFFDSSILEDTGFDDFVRISSDDSNVTDASHKFDKVKGRVGKGEDLAAEIETGTRDAKKRRVAVTIGSYRMMVPIAAYVAWEKRMRMEHGFSENAIASEAVKLLGMDIE